MLVQTDHTQTVRRAFKLFETGSVDALVELYHPQVELNVVGVLAPPAASYRGVESVRAYLQGLVDGGMNVPVEDLELVEADRSVVAAGRISAPANVLMRWTFDFDGDLISRVTSSEERWAPLNGREFAIARVADAPAGGKVVVRLADGRSLSLPVDSVLAPFATPSAPVLVFFDGDEPAGWYLPEAQRGMVGP